MNPILDVKHEMQSAYVVRSIVTWEALTTESEVEEILQAIETRDAIEDEHYREIEKKDAEFCDLETKVEALEQEIENLKDGLPLEEATAAWRKRCRDLLAAARKYKKAAQAAKKPRRASAKRTRKSRGES